MKYSKLHAKDYARENMKGIWAAVLNPFNEDFTMKQFNEWNNDISTIGVRIDTLVFTLSTLREIRDGSKTKTEKK